MSIHHMQPCKHIAYVMDWPYKQLQIFSSATLLWILKKKNETFILQASRANFFTGENFKLKQLKQCCKLRC